uniref:Ig-like domain-containing protein n=1 Tax=Hucho hucho TaxID=62062 RepID=A0A4W5KCS3_9TELE
MVEGHQYQLQFHVQNIAPIERLRVTFYKVNTTGEQTELDTQISKDNIKTPVNTIYTLDFTPSRDDDGAQLWCSAMLDLGPEGPQPPPVMKSDNLNITVHYKPLITMSPERFSMSITEGDPLSLNCSAKGNPAPSYNWLLPQADPKTMEERSVVTITKMAKTHSGNYTCNARNPLGNSIWTVNVKVTGEMDG